MRGRALVGRIQQGAPLTRRATSYGLSGPLVAFFVGAFQIKLFEQALTISSLSFPQQTLVIAETKALGLKSSFQLHTEAKAPDFICRMPGQYFMEYRKLFLNPVFMKLGFVS